MRKTIIIECRACHGTGLYKGYAEKDGSAVICSLCEGTGKEDFTYNKFEGRKEMKGVNRVYLPSRHIISDEDKIIHDEDGKNEKTIHFSKFGCSYEDWTNGVEPTPIEELVCPFQQYEIRIDRGPGERCAEGCFIGSVISNCKYYDDKSKCWEKYHSKKD